MRFLIAAVLVLSCGFCACNSQTNNGSFDSDKATQSNLLPSGLDANDVAKVFAGHWIVRFPPKKLPNGEVENSGYGITYKFAPTRTHHGTWAYDSGGNSGTWTIAPGDLMKNNGGYRFLLQETRRNKLGSNMDTYIEQLTKTSCEVVTKLNGTELIRGKATRQ